MPRYKRPDYKKIYKEIIARKYPDKMKQCETILKKEYLIDFDIIKLSNILNAGENKENQIFKSYDKESILCILEFQKKHKYNNTEVSNVLSISRNTIGKWRKLYTV